MFALYANKNDLTVRQRERITSGSINAYDVRFEFSPDWEHMTRRAVFRAGTAGRLLEAPWTGDNISQIPWEVMTAPAVHVYAGIYGTQGETVVLPTVWADLGLVLEGASAGDNAKPPTPDLWQQTVEGKGDRLGYTEEGELGLFAGDRLLSSARISDGVGGTGLGLGHGLAVRDGDLTVVTTDGFEGDNTLPMTAAGVQAAVGNIDVLLSTI